MANVLSTLFQDIANAIRGKTGGNEKMAPADFPAKIAAIKTSGGGTGEGIQWVAATGEFTPTTTGEAVTVEHGLGVVPDFVFVVHPMWYLESTKSQYSAMHLTVGCAMSSEISAQTGINKFDQMGMTYYPTNNNATSSYTPSQPLDGDVIDSTFGVAYKANASTFVVGAGADLHGGKKYQWMAIGHK